MSPAGTIQISGFLFDPTELSMIAGVYVRELA
jgi:hypothetical protein